jgi:hypothetical protein
MNSINIGDNVLATFPNSSLTVGGKVVMVIAQRDKEPEYCVAFSVGHHTFPLVSVKKD